MFNGFGSLIPVLLLGQPNISEELKEDAVVVSSTVIPAQRVGQVSKPVSGAHIRSAFGVETEAALRLCGSLALSAITTQSDGKEEDFTLPEGVQISLLLSLATWNRYISGNGLISLILIYYGDVS